MNDATIQALANAITANAQALCALIQTLPKPALEQLEAAILQDAVDPVPQAVPEVPQAVPEVPQAVPEAPAVTPAVPSVPVPVPPAVPAAAPSGFAFPNGESVMQYVMRKYKELGPVKGASIQAVLDGLGAKNINALKPEQYFEFYTKVEAL